MFRIIRMTARAGSPHTPKQAPAPRPRTARQRRSDALGEKVAALMCVAVLLGLVIFIATHL